MAALKDRPKILETTVLIGYLLSLFMAYLFVELALLPTVYGQLVLLPTRTESTRTFSLVNSYFFATRSLVNSYLFLW